MASEADPPEGTIVREVHIDASPERVYAFFVDPDLLIRWKGIRALLVAEPGGQFYVDIDGTHVVRGTYLELEPGARIVFTWGWEPPGPPLPPGSTTVIVTLQPERGGTRLRLEHRGLPPFARDLHENGWDRYLPRLVEAARAP